MSNNTTTSYASEGNHHEMKTATNSPNYNVDELPDTTQQPSPPAIPATAQISKLHQADRHRQDNPPARFARTYSYNAEDRKRMWYHQCLSIGDSHVEDKWGFKSTHASRSPTPTPSTAGGADESGIRS